MSPVFIYFSLELPGNRLVIQTKQQFFSKIREIRISC